MTILLTGGTGKTGIRVARLLQKADQPVLITSRSGTAPAPFKGVHFDWFDPATHENPFNVASDIDRIYLIGPSVLDMLTLMKPFIDLAVSKGVKRFVLLGASILEQGGPSMGEVHAYLVKLGVDYCVVRPSWFMENFAAQFLASIRDENVFVSTAEDGRIPFISADDIADVVFDALVDEKSHNTDHIVVGPELYTYDEVAALLSEVLRRKIIHKRLSKNEALTLWLSFGLPEDLAETFVGLEMSIASGAEEKFFYAKEKIVGRRYLREYLEANRETWVAQK